MKKVMMIIALVAATMTMHAQSQSDRRTVVSAMNSQWRSQGLAMTAEAYGSGGMMLMHKGSKTYSLSFIKNYIQAAGWVTWSAAFNTYGFQFICFEGVDKCYTPSDIRQILAL